MTQEAVVTKLLANGMAEVSVRRTTACGGNCGACESCVFENELKTQAKNCVDACPGQKVLVESKSTKIFAAAFLVYVLPLLFFLAGYLLAAALGLSEPGCIVSSFVFLTLAAAYVVVSQRKKRGKDDISFEIVSIL